MTEQVKRPSHYVLNIELAIGRDLEVRDIINERCQQFTATEMYQRSGALYDYANAIKYILRAPFKNGRQDLEKALECINLILESDCEPASDIPEALRKTYENWRNIA